MRRFICVLIQARTHFQQCNDAHGYSLNIHIVCHTTKKPYQCKLYNKSFTYICHVGVYLLFCVLFFLLMYFPLVNGPFMVTLNVDVIASRNYSPSDRSWLTSYCTLFDIAFLYSTCIKSYKIISSFILISMFLSLQTSHKLILYYTLVPCCIEVLSFSYKDEEKSKWWLPGVDRVISLRPGKNFRYFCS